MTDETRMSPVTKPANRPWYVWDIALVVGFVLLCISLFGVPLWIEYRDAVRTGYHEMRGSHASSESVPVCCLCVV